jgi:hypothetical protein
MNCNASIAIYHFRSNRLILHFGMMDIFANISIHNHATCH